MLSSSNIDYLDSFKREVVSTCKLCLGNGWVNGIMCDCWNKYILEVKKVQAHIPKKYFDFTLDSIMMPESEKAKKYVLQYIEQLDTKRKTGEGLFLWSENKGTAKTSFGCIILLEALRKGYSAYFTDLNECVTLTTSGWFDDTKRGEFERSILGTDFLLIDDVGGMEIKTKSNDALIGSTFTTLFRRRCNDLLPTIMTSNLAPTDLGDDYNERLYSIACEHLKSVECQGPDFRQIMAQKRKK